MLAVQVSSEARFGDSLTSGEETRSQCRMSLLAAGALDTRKSEVCLEALETYYMIGQVLGIRFS